MSLKSQISAASTAGSSAASAMPGRERLAERAGERPEAPETLAHRDGRRGGDEPVVVGSGGEGGGEAGEERAQEADRATRAALGGPTR